MTTTVVLTYIATKFIDQFISEEGYGRAKRLFFPKRKYIQQLSKIIHETIDEYEKNNPAPIEGNKFPFYQAQVLFVELSSYILFKSKNSYVNVLREFEKNSNVIPPSRKELQSFYKIFNEKVKNDPKLAKLHFDENYKSEIFEISGKLDTISKKVGKVDKKVEAIKKFTDGELAKQITLKQTISALNAQVQRQLKKQLNTTKYLPNTFIETGNHKDHLRYLCDPLFYINKCFHEIAILDFRLLNKQLIKEGQSEFVLDWDKKSESLKNIDISNCTATLSHWINDLSNKKKEIKDLITKNRSLTSTFEYKFTDRIEDLNYFISKISLITETAGQGKTNFICDFVDNFLSKRDIPTVFLTGSEINESNIRKGILHSIFPDKDSIEFAEFLEIIKKYCLDNKVYFIIIIDGINENRDTNVLSKTLEQFLGEIIEHEFIRVVLTCRTDYFEHNFNNIVVSSFKDEIVQTNSLLQRRVDDEIKEKLLATYFHHFNIKYKTMSRDANEKLVSNFLLLRIFSETYQNENFDFIDDIYKEELFENYFNLKTNEINSRYSGQSTSSQINSFDIKEFLSKVIQYMIETKQYVNIPLDKVLVLKDDKELYIKFLDENILIKRDPVQDEIFGLSEVVNFTFDEFRDFLISKYLIKVTYKQSRSKFIDFLNDQLNENTPILEGCSTFLFFVSRRNESEDLTGIIKEQPWYDHVFTRNIFKVKDENISEDDIEVLKSQLIARNAYSNTIIWSLIKRYDTEFYNNLNINTLIDLLITLNDNDFHDVFNSSFHRTENRFGHLDQKHIIESFEPILADNNFHEKPRYHGLFEILIYMFDSGYGWLASRTYERYAFKYPEQAVIQLNRARNAKNEGLKFEIQKFADEYDFSL